VGSGHWKAEDQALRDGPRQIRDLEEDKVIGQKARRRVTHGRPVIVPFMHAHRVPCVITTQCPIREISRSGSEAWGHRPPVPGARRVERMRAVLAESGARNGRPKITAVLRPAGERMSQNTGAQWRRDPLRRARVTRNDPATTHARHAFPVQENVLNQTLTADRPHAVWIDDIPDIATEGGFSTGVMGDIPLPFVGKWNCPYWGF
jgi:hypothetical protein